MNNQDVMNDVFNTLVSKIVKMNLEDPFLSRGEIDDTISDLMSGMSLNLLNESEFNDVWANASGECAYKIGGYKMVFSVLPEETLNELNINLKTL